MFTLVYLAMFGVKKGSIVAYESSWNFNFSQFASALAATPAHLKSVFGYRFQQTSVTSRSTSYFLITF
jgi:hypothetical protein